MVFPFPQTNLCQDDKLVLYCDNQILIEKFPHFQIAVLCVSVKRPRSKNLCKKNIWWQCVWGKECVQTLVKGKKQNFSFVFFFSRILDQHPRAAIQSVCTEISIILFICLSKNCHTFVRGRLSNPPSFTCLHKHTFYKVPQWVISSLFELMPV